MIEDAYRLNFRKRFDEVVNRYPSENILSVDTGVYFDDGLKTYYAFICVILGG
jgi:hypothetical protein